MNSGSLALIIVVLIFIGLIGMGVVGAVMAHQDRNKTISKGTSITMAIIGIGLPIIILFGIASGK